MRPKLTPQNSQESWCAVLLQDKAQSRLQNRGAAACRLGAG
ncbi:hypothetical protein SLEP1_g20110 [Rubroshorea leprosula]|uniref:Uncharacterized protein n=1 Tax=Rubroshorea leprosula TaxID=152421 RepID=A0AAV5JAM3_9ROSI|nr:hypothetical protein SLEP1_g20110 [Rubroshorea leprosula]